MSNIKFENTNFVIYKIILQEAIDDIKQRIGITDEEIEWVIFDEKDYMENNLIKKMSMPSFIYQNQYKYGFCYTDTKKIYISTATIMTSKMGFFKSKIAKMPWMQDEKGIFLVNVILDELVHIKTEKNHGDEEYDATLEKYYATYYNNPLL